MKSRMSIIGSSRGLARLRIAACTDHAPTTGSGANAVARFFAALYEEASWRDGRSASDTMIKDIPMSASGLPFDDFRELLRNLPGPDSAALVAARERDAQLTKPPGALGRLEEIAFWLAAWTGRPPAVNRPLVAIFAGNHGVTKQGVTPFPSSVTAQMVENFAAGGAAINQICVSHDLGLKIFDLALDYPTGDITEEAALSERDCAATMAFGMEAVAGGTDLLCIGEMGIGNTTIAAAINLALNPPTPPQTHPPPKKKQMIKNQPHHAPPPPNPQVENPPPPHPSQHTEPRN
jgi:hypothetical protein